MKAISLWQPWATLVTVGRKQIETRSWATGYRGPLLIHAAKRPMDYIGRALLAACGLHDDVPLGALLCCVDLLDCWPTDGGGNLYNPEKQRGDCIKVDPNERCLGDYSLHRFGWMLKWRYRLDPIPCRGRQRLFVVPDEILNKGRG